MENITTFTKLERKIIALSLNYFSKEEQLSDNYCNFNANMIAKTLKVSEKAIGGAVSSLIKKKIFYLDEEYKEIEFSTNGINTIFNQNINWITVHTFCIQQN